MYTKIEDLKSSQNKQFQSVNILIANEQDFENWSYFLTSNTPTIKELTLSFDKDNVLVSSGLAIKANELLQYISNIESLHLYTYISDYALKQFLDNPHLTTIENLSFINSSSSKFSGLNETFFNLHLISYLHKNPHLKTLHINGTIANLKSSQYPNLKEAMSQHPTLCNFSQWIAAEGDLAKDPDLLYCLAQKKLTTTIRKNTLDEDYELLIRELRVLFGAFEDPYIREHNEKGWQDAEKNIDEQQKNWQSFRNNIAEQKDEETDLETKKTTVEFALNILLLLRKVISLEKKRRNGDAPDFLNEFLGISKALLTNISSKLATNSDLSSELLVINSWLERFKTVPDEIYQLFRSKKYFIYTEKLHCGVTVKDLLALISDQNNDLAHETTYPKITFGDNLHVPGYEQISKELLHQHNLAQTPITGVQSLTTHQTRYSSILEELNLTKKHLSEQQVISIIDSFIDTIYQVHSTKIDAFMADIFEEISLRKEVAEPKIKETYQKKRRYYLDKELVRSLQGQSTYSHQEKKLDGEGYSDNESINKLIKEDIDHSCIQYEINKLRLDLSRLLVRDIVVFYPARELSAILRVKLQQLPEKIKNIIWPRFNSIQNNEKLSDGEKIVRYFFLLYEIRAHREIQDLLTSYFFSDRKQLLRSYLHTSECNEPLAAYKNVAEVLKTYLQENRPFLHNYLVNYVKQHASKDISELLLFAEACHQMMTKGAGLGFFNNPLKKEVKLENTLLNSLTSFYSGEMPVAGLANNLCDLIKHSPTKST